MLLEEVDGIVEGGFVVDLCVGDLCDECVECVEVD